jgi:glyoxylase-like metal-dependent hydrolase (beta-lactamase superfamily II)
MYSRMKSFWSRVFLGISFSGGKDSRWVRETAAGFSVSRSRSAARASSILLLLQSVPLAAWAAFQQVAPDVFLWKNTCNSYVVRSGTAAVLIDPGDGTVFSALPELKVSRIERVLLTAHHRELLQGLVGPGVPPAPVAISKEEQPFLETPGSSYLRPPRVPVAVSHGLEDGDQILFGDKMLTVWSTPGHSPGGVSYRLVHGDSTCVFSGGLMHDGARFSNWFDTEWDYGFGKGLDALMASVEKMAGTGVARAFPSHGPVIEDAAVQFQRFSDRLKEFRPDYLRGYPVETMKQRGAHPATKPTKAGPIVQVTPPTEATGFFWIAASFPGRFWNGSSPT